MATNNQALTSQQEFDKRYISSQEICEYLEVSRVALFKAIDTDRFPKAHVCVGGGRGVHLWLRELVRETLVGWKNKRDAI